MDLAIGDPAEAAAAALDVMEWTTTPLPPLRVEGGTDECGARRKRTPYFEWNLEARWKTRLDHSVRNDQATACFLLNYDDDLIKPTPLHMMMNNDNSEEGSGSGNAVNALHAKNQQPAVAAAQLRGRLQGGGGELPPDCVGCAACGRDGYGTSKARRCNKP